MKRFLAIFCCTFFAAIVFAESNYGKNLFSETNNFLINQKCNPIYEPLVQSTKNDFPSNIYVNFFSPNANDYTPNIILVFTMEDTVTNKDLLKNLIHLLQTSPLQTNVTLFFSYGDSITQEVQGLVKGTDAFAKNIQEPENTIALCIGFSTSLSTRIITSGKHDIAPLWLSKALTTSLLQNKIPFVIRGGTINALFKFGILPFDLRTSFFLEQNIPSIGMLISSNYETENYISFFKTFLEEAHNNYSSEWDRHYTIFKLGENIFFANEKIMVIFFIIISFISLFALSREIILFETKKDYLKAVFFQLFFFNFYRTCNHNFIALHRAS
ncbi:MAG: hypothetical protein IKI31_03315, partial [Treponema sp.]|nr:hypothetical protein [Treponema sp.]